eukprot:4076747-Heterocapsa_arctica.AAC.1
MVENTVPQTLAALAEWIPTRHGRAHPALLAGGAVQSLGELRIPRNPNQNQHPANNNGRWIGGISQLPGDQHDLL